MFAIAVVIGTHLVVSDVGELFKRPRRHDTPGFSDSWRDEREKDQLEIELPSESVDTPDNNIYDEPEEC